MNSFKQDAAATIAVPFQRNRTLYAIAIVLVIGSGLLWRSGIIPLSRFASKYGGDALWALVVFLGVGWLFRRTPTLQVALIAVCIAWSVEFLQLYHAPWIESLRNTVIGRLTLGSFFNGPDLIAYVLGIVLGAAMESAYRHHTSKKVRKT